MQACFIDRLTPRTWRRHVWPRLRADAARGAPLSVRYVDATPAGEALARRAAQGTALRIARFDFAATDMHDETGKLVWLRIYYEDMADALRVVARQPAFRDFLARDDVSPHLARHLVKQVLPGTSVILPGGLWRAIYLLHACLWQARRDGVAAREVTLFLESRPCMAAFTDYAREATGATVIPAGSRPVLVPLLARLLGQDLRNWRDRIGRALHGELGALRGPARAPSAPPSVALQYYGHFNVDQPAFHSDFFFWQCSGLPGRNLLALFALPQDPLDEAKRAQLAAHGIRAAALNHRATTLPAAHVCAPAQLARSLAQAADVLLEGPGRSDAAWLDAEARVFESRRRHWRGMFRANNVRVFTTWFKYDAEHCAIAQALDDLDGTLAVYQRSFEGNALVQGALSTDICFAFSKSAAATESAAGSRIGHCVVTGYLGDHRFSDARSRAAPVRAALKAAGASYIAAYFDENSVDDGRWMLGHAREQRHYAFLLQKVMDDARFGLVLKPKSPRTLRHRLGPAAELLDRARATGRCHIYEDGVLQGSTTPAQAALSADLAIHSSVAAATAGVEAALAGAAVILFDDDGWSISPLIRLGRGRVIFDDWEAMWHTWLDHRETAGGIVGFADWAPMLDDLDPYRDGRAAERMGTYLQWLIEGYEAGHSKPEILAEAADRYARAWGGDKIFKIGGAL